MVLLAIVLLLVTVVSEVVRENRFEVLDLDDGKISSKYVVSQPPERDLRFRKFVKKIGKIAKVAVKVKAIAKTGGAAGAKMKAKAKVAKVKKAKAMKTKAKKMKSAVNKIKQVSLSVFTQQETVSQLGRLEPNVESNLPKIRSSNSFTTLSHPQLE